jgi:3alpha(or 20beta)-hydroxysteroid dehydrogenase
MIPHDVVMETVQAGRLAGKVAIITGAARGQGEAEARLFAAEGARLVLTDILEKQVAEVAAGIGEAAISIGHDVSETDRWPSIVAAATEHFGGVDILVNNAAVHWIRPVSQEDAADIRRILDVNLVGPMMGMQAVAPAMQARGGGSIVNISSLAGLTGFYGHGAYGASKWGLRGVTKVAAVELGPLGIRVNSIHPGMINTDMLPNRESLTPERFRHVPMQRVGLVDDIAEMVLYLASDASSFLTGAEIAVDGGSSAGRALGS